MNTNSTNSNRVISITKSISIAISVLFFAMHSEAGEIEPPLKILTFTGVPTENALRAGSFEHVIDAYLRFGPNYTFHDLVNLCAAHMYRTQYVEASNACSQAECYRAKGDLPTIYRGPDAWVAYTNGGVAHALNGDFESACNKIVDAPRRSGNPAVIERNFVAIEYIANRFARVSMSD